MGLGTLKITDQASWPTAVGAAYLTVFDGYCFFDEYCSSPVNRVLVQAKGNLKSASGRLAS